MADTLLLSVLLILVGIASGALSGLLGIGGAVVMVPVMVYLLRFNHHAAQGTFLAMISLPVSIFAAYTYYRAGNVNLKAALLLGIGFMSGSLLGALFANRIESKTLARAFGAMLILLGAKTLLFP